MAGDDSPNKVGAGHAGAMWRQGLAELRAAVYPDSNIAQPVEYGMAGTPTPGQIDRSTRSQEGDGPSSVVADLEKRAASAREEPGREPSAREMET